MGHLQIAVSHMWKSAILIKDNSQISYIGAAGQCNAVQQPTT